MKLYIHESFNGFTLFGRFYNTLPVFFPVKDEKHAARIVASLLGSKFEKTFVFCTANKEDQERGITGRYRKACRGFSNFLATLTK